jgi:hypothetical protein
VEKQGKFCLGPLICPDKSEPCPTIPAVGERLKAVELKWVIDFSLIRNFESVSVSSDTIYSKK